MEPNPLETRILFASFIATLQSYLAVQEASWEGRGVPDDAELAAVARELEGAIEAALGRLALEKGDLLRHLRFTLAVEHPGGPMASIQTENAGGPPELADIARAVVGMKLIGGAFQEMLETDKLDSLIGMLNAPATGTVN